MYRLDHRIRRTILAPGLVLTALMLMIMAGGAFGPQSAEAAGPNAIRAGFDSNTFARNDDGSIGAGIGFTINYFGANYNSLHVNNNGNVTFDGALSTYTPFNIISAGRVIMAPFFGDVDTRSGGDPVRYGPGTVDGRPAFGVTWNNVDCYAANAFRAERNSFQLIIIDRSDTGVGNFDMEFNYDQIQWQAGQASGGNLRTHRPHKWGASRGILDLGQRFGKPGPGFDLR